MLYNVHAVLMCFRVNCRKFSDVSTKMTERHKTQTNLSEMHIKLNAKNIQIIKDFIEIEWFFIQMIRFGEL